MKKHIQVAMLGLIVLIVGLAACGGGDLHSKALTRSDYGADWPLTVEDARLWCKGREGIGIVWVHTGHVAYPLNGTAKGGVGSRYFTERGFSARDISNIWQEGGISQFELIGEGLKLCGG